MQVVNEQYLGEKEFNYLIDSLQDDGYLRLLRTQTQTYGLLRTNDGNQFKCTVNSIDNTKIDISSGFAWGEDYVFENFETQTLPLPIENTWYWVRIQRQAYPWQVGTVSIAVDGTITGIGTQFTSLLRGGSRIPTKIRFNSALNTGHYTVVDVISDTQIIVAGLFSAESSIQYSVIGTLTPNISLDSNQLTSFDRNGCQITLHAESITNTAPITLVQDRQFWIARVRWSGLSVVVEDKRSQWWSLKQEDYIADSENPVIGIDGIIWDTLVTTKTENIALGSWGVQSTNWTIDSNTRTVTLNACEGGRIKTVADVVSGDFDGWRLYTRSGAFYTIKQSIVQGSQVNLILAHALQSDFVANQSIAIVPNYEHVQWEWLPNPAVEVSDIQQIHRRFEFPIQQAQAKMPIVVPTTTANYLYVVRYRYRNANSYTPWTYLPSDSVGFYTENSYTDQGGLKSEIDRVRYPYVSSSVIGFIQVIPHPNHYGIFTYNIDLGDLLRVNERVLTFADTLITLNVGTDAQVQLYTGGPITLTQDLIFNISQTGVRNGNQFILLFDCDINLDGNAITIYGNYTNPGSPGTLLYRLSPTDVDYCKWPGQKIAVWCFYTGTQWTATVIEKDNAQLGNIRAQSDVPVDAFSGAGVGVVSDFYGWALCDGQNGRPSLMEGSFLMGSISPGTSGGSNTKTITKQNLPLHTHAAGSLSTANDSHAHQVYVRNSGTSVGQNTDAQFGRGSDKNLTSGSGGQKATDINTHNHSIIGATENGTLDGLTNTPIDITPKHYKVAWIMRIPKP